MLQWVSVHMTYVVLCNNVQLDSAIYVNSEHE